MWFQKKHEFRPDKAHSGTLNKLYITKKQRLSILKWTLMAAALVLISVLQDVILSQFRIFGATTDLLCGALLLVCIMLDPEQGCVFILIGSALYEFSGSSPGPYVIALLTVIGLVVSIFRQAYLHQGFACLIPFLPFSGIADPFLAGRKEAIQKARPGYFHKQTETCSEQLFSQFRILQKLLTHADTHDL